MKFLSLIALVTLISIPASFAGRGKNRGKSTTAEAATQSASAADGNAETSTPTGSGSQGNKDQKITFANGAQISFQKQGKHGGGPNFKVNYAPKNGQGKLVAKGSGLGKVVYTERAKFLWFQADAIAGVMPTNRYYIFDDGSYAPSLSSHWEFAEAILLENGGKKFLLEYTVGPLGHVTFLSEIGHPERGLALDTNKHTSAPGIFIEDGILKTAGLPIQVDLVNWCKIWKITAPSQLLKGDKAFPTTFSIKSCSNMSGSKKSGIWIRRESDGKVLKAAEEGLFKAEAKIFEASADLLGEDEMGLQTDERVEEPLKKMKPEFSLAQGILTFDELRTSVDILLFDAELYQRRLLKRRLVISGLLKPSDLHESESKAASDLDSDTESEVSDSESQSSEEQEEGIAAVMGGKKELDPFKFVQSFDDVVAIARNAPDFSYQVADPLVIQGLKGALWRGKSAVILGKSGTGKTSAARAFFREVALGRVPGFPRTTEIREILPFTLSSGSGNVGDVENKIEALITVSRTRNVIFFMDNIHTLGGVGTHSGNSNDVTTWISSSMAKGALRIIGTATDSQFIDNFAGDPSFVSQFIPVKLAEPKGPVLREILTQKMESLQAKPLSPSMMEAVILRSSQYSAFRNMPQAATTFLESCLGSECDYIDQEVTPEHFARASTRLYGPNLDKLYGPALRSKLGELQSGLDEHHIGQATSKAAILDLWRRKLSGVGRGNAMDSILFVGAPGVGKTSIAELAAKLMGYAVVKIEMNQYSRSAMDGIAEFRRRVYKALLESPQTVIILDEFEKASIEVQNGSLSMLESGEFTVMEKSGRGQLNAREVNARNAMFILTSNAAADYVRHYVETQGKSPMNDANLRQAIKMEGQIPEQIVSRISKVIAVANPSREEFKLAIERGIKKVLDREKETHGIEFVLKSFESPKNKESFVQRNLHSWSEKVDYRDVRRITQMVESLIARALANTTESQPKSLLLEWTGKEIREGLVETRVGVL